ncbi:MAG: sigma-70 family RNA polymerase sigma factor [Clostridia bacterium]|nr:sigma-70 family RNA polymerase sigma factor [Clostridia bacterium]
MDDRQIIAMLFQRNDHALKEIALKYGKLIFRVADNILCCHENSRECVNDTYLAVWNSIPPQNPNPFIAFICKITRNLSLKKLRDKNALKRRSQTLPIYELEHELSDCSFEDKIDARELGRKIDSFLDTVDEESRVIFVKRYWFSDEIAEIAKATGLSESYVYTKLSRTRKKLRTCLEKEGLM